MATPAPQPAARPSQVADAGQPAARLPTAEVAARPRPVATVEQRTPQPGDRICGNCGEANDSVRKFCRRCGTSLLEARVVTEKPLPWWRRLFRRKPKGPKQYAAGQRFGTTKAAPKSGGGPLSAVRGALQGIGLVRAGLALIVGIGIFGYIGIPSFQGFVNGAVSGGIPGIVDKIKGIVAPTLQIERPVSFTASSEVKNHTAAMLFDTFVNTDWQGTDKVPTITVKFKEPVDLGAVILHLGSADAFVATQRPAELDLTFSDGSTATIKPKDVHDPQTFDLSASKVTSVEIKIGAMNGPDGAPVSISEIEFFKKS
jgi:hypothetical protein